MNSLIRMVHVIIFIILVFCSVISANEAFVDQLGYLPGSEKYVLADFAGNEFKVYNTQNSQQVLTGTMLPFIGNDPSSGLTLYRGDFSSLSTPGSYRVVIDNSTLSAVFVIADSVYNPLFKKSLKSFYYQRCGTDLLGATAGNYYHTRCHPADGFLHNSTGENGFHSASGGWHDAGDFGKYVVNAGISVGTLLMAYEYFPQKFDSDNLHIPESGNGVPDLLDEVRYELNWFLKMQRADGAVYFKLTAENFSAMIMPQSDASTRYIYEVSSTATASFAAVMARAARVYQAYDASFSASCLLAAQTAWNYLQAHPAIFPDGGFHNPIGTGTGQYGDSNDSDERLWAAAELWETTLNSDYHNYFLTHYADQGLFSGTFWWGRVEELAQLTYLKSSHTADQTARSQLIAALNDGCQALTGKRNQNGFSVTLVPGEYNWGSNSRVLNNAILLILGSELLGSPAYESVAEEQLHYILGNNALKRCFVTGIGANPPMHIHHRQSEADGIVDPVPGLLAGGPDQWLSDPVLQNLYDASTPPALCYTDQVGSYASNEIAINWNAPLVFVSGYYSSLSATAIETNLPGEKTSFNLYAVNYPNPFNGSTRIQFNLLRADDVLLEIFNSGGQLVDSLRPGKLGQGHHSIDWPENTKDLNHFASGTYYYRISLSSGRSANGKMLLIK